jgi:hypothetical protein
MGARDTSPSTTGVRSEGNLGGRTTRIAKGGGARGETMGVSEFKGILGGAPRLWYSNSHWAQMSKMTSFTSPAKEFRLTSETFRLL